MTLCSQPMTRCYLTGAFALALEQLTACVSTLCRSCPACRARIELEGAPASQVCTQRVKMVWEREDLSFRPCPATCLLRCPCIKMQQAPKSLPA